MLQNILLGNETTFNFWPLATISKIAFHGDRTNSCLDQTVGTFFIFHILLRGAWTLVYTAADYFTNSWVYSMDIDTGSLPILQYLNCFYCFTFCCWLHNNTTVSHVRFIAMLSKSCESTVPITLHRTLWSVGVILFLPARRYASAGNCDRNVSVCPSVCLSVTRRYCVKTKKASGLISSPSRSPKTLVYV